MIDKQPSDDSSNFLLYTGSSGQVNVEVFVKLVEDKV